MAGAGNQNNAVRPSMAGAPAPRPHTMSAGAPPPHTTPVIGGQVQQPQQPGIFGQAAGAFNGALSGTERAMGMPDIGAFQNPYTQQVVGNSMDAMNRARQMTLNDVGAAATGAGAFGGSRHGIAEAETNRNFFDSAGQMAGNLNMQGFNTALQGAQNQQQMQLAGAGQLGNLAGQGFGMGQSINQAQNQQGTQQQAVMQALIDAARGQVGGFTGSPGQSLQLPLAALGAIPGGGGQTSTTSQRPGLFNILGLLAGL